MKKSADIRQIRFYLWVGLAYLLLWLFSELVNNPETFFQRAVNNTWRACYIVVLNFILFEYTFPFIGRKRRTILLNIIVAVPVIFVHLMLYSWGLYAWRLIGISLHIYTPLAVLGSEEQVVTQQMGYSVM